VKLHNSEILAEQRGRLQEQVTLCHDALVQDLVDTVSSKISLGLEVDDLRPHTLILRDPHFFVESKVFDIQHGRHENDTVDYEVYDDVLSEVQTERLKEHIEHNRFFLHAKRLGEQIQQLSVEIKELAIIEHMYEQTVRALKSGPRLDYI